MSNLLNIKDQNGNWIPIPVITNGIRSITQNQDYTLTITLNDGTTYTTTSIKGEDGQDYVLTAQDKADIAGLVDVPVDDVQVNGTSIVTNGTANVPIANGQNTLGLTQYNSTYGVTVNASGQVQVFPAISSEIKGGTNDRRPISPSVQHESVFYGLAKAAGDTTQASSNNTVGNYTDNAKTAIRQMLGIDTASLVAEIRNALDL